MLVGDVRSVTQQSAAFCERAIEIDRGHPIVHGWRSELHETAVEQRVGTEQEGLGPLLREARKGRIDVAIGAGVKDFRRRPSKRYGPRVRTSRSLPRLRRPRVFNLALLLQRNNKHAEAAEHWRRYLANDAQSKWAERARRSLKFCEMHVHLSESSG